jgi:hypothetical protein
MTIFRFSIKYCHEFHILKIRNRVDFRTYVTDIQYLFDKNIYLF